MLKIYVLNKEMSSKLNQTRPNKYVERILNQKTHVIHIKSALLIDIDLIAMFSFQK